MKIKQLTLYFLSLMVFHLVGCSSLSLNEGAVDYRYVQENDDQSQNFDARYFSPSEYNSIKTPSPIIENQSISISLKQVFICDFREAGWTDWSLSDPFTVQEKCAETGLGGGVDTRGEIMIVANVFERVAGNLISFDPAALNTQGRVVFYSDDVRESGQYLNLSNLPIYGPQTYTGNPIYIVFTIQELDTEENKQMQAVLGTLAKMGGAAYPPAAPIMGILNALGGTILSSDTDDVEFRYHAVLDANGGHPDVYVPLILPGDYVVIRKEKRLEPIDWGNLTLNRKTGRLQRCDPKCIDYIESTYFTFSVNTFQKTFPLDAAQTVGEFLQKNANFNEKKMAKFIAESQKIGATIQQIKDYDDIRNSLNSIEIASNAKEKKAKSIEFAKLLCTALSAELNSSPVEPSRLTNNQLNFLLSQLVNRYQVSPDKVTRNNLQEKCNKSINPEEALVNDLGIGN